MQSVSYPAFKVFNPDSLREPDIFIFRFLSRELGERITFIPNKNRLIKTLPLLNGTGSSFRDETRPATRVPPGFIPVFRDMKTVFFHSAP